jgi:hypothetical protein
MEMCVEEVIFNGFRYGTIQYIDKLWYFEGAVPRNAIPGLPFLDLSKNPDLRTRLLERGRRALDMQTIRYMKTVNTGSGEEKSMWLKGNVSQHPFYLEGHPPLTFCFYCPRINKELSWTIISLGRERRGFSASSRCQGTISETKRRRVGKKGLTKMKTTIMTTRGIVT